MTDQNDQSPSINNSSPANDALMQKLLCDVHEKLKIVEFYMQLKGWDKSHKVLYEEIFQNKIGITFAGMALEKAVEDTTK